MAKLFNSVKRATVAETIVEQVKDLIIDGQLIAGQKLPSERELAEEFSVGRSYRCVEATSVWLPWALRRCGKAKAYSSGPISPSPSSIAWIGRR